MRFYNKQHRFYCGIDLHARTMFVVIIDQAGEDLHLVLARRPVHPREGPPVLGHALYMKAIHGGKAKTDKIDAHKIAALLRGGMIPQAYVYPAPMRSTRDLLRRRLYLVRQRAELLSHILNTNSQCNLPDFGGRINYKSNREGVAERFLDASVRKSIEVDLQLLDHYDNLIQDLELYIVRTAKVHGADTFHRLRSIPGVVKTLAMTISGRAPWRASA